MAYVSTTLDMGGAELALYRLLKHFPPGFEHGVISLLSPGPVGAQIAALGVPVKTLNLRAALPDPRAPFSLARLLRADGPDVVQTWMYHADLIGGLAARIARIPGIVWGIRNTALDPDGTKRTTRAVVRVCSRLSRWLPSRIVSCSERALQVHVGRGYDADKFAVIPNGVELDVFHHDDAARVDVRAELGVPPDAPLIGLVARFHSLKNHRGFFEAAGRLHARRSDARFILVGPGVDEKNAQIRKWRDDAGVAAVTHLLGTRADVPRLQAALDIATLSSWGEAFPNVLAEAMACGVPCVATDVGDSALILGDTGKIVPAGDTSALAAGWDALLALSAAERAALGRQARTRIERLFDIKAVAQRYADLYTEIAVRGSAATRVQRGA